MSFFRFFRRKKSKPVSPWKQPLATGPVQTTAPQGLVAPHARPASHTDLDVRRYFHNEHHFQCYTSWFSHWGGWISAGHCLTDAQDHLPDFAANMEITSWPDGLDAALAGCTIPSTPPAHIFEPDEPVVTGMSGGPVLDAQTLEPIGITITRNSPADLNNDRDPDESADFIALSDVWKAISGEVVGSTPGTV